MRMRPRREYRRRQRGAAALVLIAAVAVSAALGCLTGAPRSWSTADSAATAHVVAGLVSEQIAPAFLRAAADPVGADLDAPCPHAQLTATVRTGDNLPLMGALPTVFGALTGVAAAGGAPVRGPPPRARVAAVAGPMSLHQLCVIRR